MTPEREAEIVEMWEQWGHRLPVPEDPHAPITLYLDPPRFVSPQLINGQPITSGLTTGTFRYVEDFVIDTSDRLLLYRVRVVCEDITVAERVQPRAEALKNARYAPLEG